MPVSGNEETGVKPVSWKSSDYIAGVPIKKRRFPMMRPPSPPPEEPSIPPSKMDMVQKEQSSQSEGSTVSHATKVPESDDRRGSSDVKSVKMDQGNDNTVRVKVEQPSLRDHLGYSEDLQRKGKFVMADNPVPQMTLGRNELTLRPTEASVSSLSKDIEHGKQLAVVKCKEEMLAIAESTSLSLSLKEHLFPALTDQKSDIGASHLSLDNSEPVLLSLSLSKDKISSQCKNKDRDLKVHGAKMQACRANWDLNTSMDAWEDSVNDALVSIDAKGGAHADSSIGMVEGGVSSDRQSDAESHKRTNLTMSSKLGSQQCESSDSLLLRLSSCSPTNLCQSPSSSTGFGLDRRNSAANLPRVVGPSSNLNIHKTVKPEPFDERVKQEPSSMEPLFRAGKHVVELAGAVKSSNMSTKKFVDPRSIKSEPTTELNQEMNVSTKEKSVQLDKQVLNGPTDSSSNMKLPIGAEISIPAGHPSRLTELTRHPSCSKELTVTRGVVNHLRDSNEKLPHEACQSNKKVAISLGPVGKLNEMRTRDDNVDQRVKKSCVLKMMNDQPLDSIGSGGTSDEEKLNISRDVLADSYGTDYESDGNHAVDTAIETKKEEKNDGFEDGEVRDVLLGSAVLDELMCEAKEVQDANHHDFDSEKTVCVGPVNIVHNTSFHVEAKEKETDNINGTSNTDHVVSSDINISSKSDKGCGNYVCMEEPSSVEKLTSSEALRGSISTVTAEPFNDQSRMRDSNKCQDAELSSEQVTIGSHAVAAAQDTEQDVSKTEPVLTSDSTLSKTSGSGDNATRDTSNGGQQSRIITLPRSLNGSPSRSISIPCQLIPSRAGTESLHDVTANEEKLHPRGRGEAYVDDMYRFPRERYQDQSWRNSRMNFRRGRGRMNNRGEWNSESYTAAEHYYNQTKYSSSRHKYVNDVSDADVEYNNFSVPLDAAFVGRGRRNLLNDGPINHRIPSRRRSPIEGQFHVPRRYVRNFSPGRCIDEDSSDLVGMRQNEKIVRGFPIDNIDPMFNRTQLSYERGGQFGRGRGNKNFSFSQRMAKGIRVRSKSPVRTRTRSPGPWSSPRRSPDGFGGPGELNYQPNYRADRFKSSPDGASFTGEMVVRRNMPNDLRDMENGRDHGPLRSGIHRSPSRILLRPRRFNVMDPQERGDNNEIFAGGLLHSGRLHAFGGDGNGDERRRFGERRPPVRTFRPPYNHANGEFNANTEDGPRPFRFRPDGETEFQERGNLKERVFDRRIKNRPGIAPRRMRSIEDQEGNIRNDGQPWNDGGFDEISRLKRKRF